MTGSVTRTLKDGTIWYRTEYEPLGNQEIAPYGNEAEFPEPQGGGTDGLKGAEEPQWQCQVAAAIGTRFWGAPRHCQMVMAQNASFEELHYTETTTTKFIPFGVDSTVKSSKMPVDPTPTQKPLDNLADMYNPLPAASIPSKSGKKKDPDVDLKNQIVTVRDNTVAGFVEASESGEDYINILVPKDFKDLIRNRLKQGDCNAFISKLIDTASKNGIKGVPFTSEQFIEKRTEPREPYAKDGFELVDKVDNYIAIFGVATIISGKIANGTISGSIPKGNATVKFIGKGIIIPPYGKTITQVTNETLERYVSTSLHELVHLAGDSFGDQELAYAVNQLGETNGKEVPTKITDGPWNELWDKALGRHCGW